MKHVVFALCLTAAVAAAPIDPPNAPGRGLSPEAVSQALDRLQAECSRRHDQEGLLQIECLRLEPLILKRDPGCPARLEALEAAAQALPPGPARARCFWVRALAAGQCQQSQRHRELQKLALQEPGLPPLWRAEWLSKLPRYDMSRAEVAWMEGQLGREVANHPDAACRWYLLAAQTRLADNRGQPDLRDTLRQARLQLAEQEHWLREQLDCQMEFRDLYPKEAVHWQRALDLAERARRDDWLRLLLRRAPSLADWQRVEKDLRKPDPDRDWLAWSSRPQGQFLDRTITARRNLLEEAHRRGDVEEELEQRFALYFCLRDALKNREGLRVLESAVLIRQEHPPIHPEWIRPSLSAGALTNVLIRELIAAGHSHQARAWMERALSEHWVQLPAEQVRLLQTAANEASRNGEDAQPWIAQAAGLIPSEIDVEWLDSVFWLAREMPESQSGEYLERAERFIVQLDRTSAFPSMRSGSSSSMAELARLRSGSAQLLQYWMNQYETAQSQGDTELSGQAAIRLLSAYHSADRFEDLKKLVVIVLQDPATNSYTRQSCLQMGSDLLARHRDPLALEWSEELLRSARSTPGTFAAADILMTRARVLSQFQRLDEALACLDEAARHQPKTDYNMVERTRIRILWESGQHEKALELQERVFQAQLVQAENASLATSIAQARAGFLRELKRDWQADLERHLVQIEGRGESGEWGRDYLLGVWLNWLAKAQEWQRGREVLARHPWRLGPFSTTTKDLRSYPEWSDLFPGGPAASAPEAEPTSLQQVVDELRLRQPELGQLLTLRSTNLKHLQNRLQPDDTLVTYCCQNGRLYVLGLRSKDSFFRVHQMSEADLEKSVNRYLDSLRSDQTGDAETSLFSLLLEPVLNENPSQRIFLVPNGTLWQVPFGALRDSQGRAAASRAQLVMMSSGDLLRLADGDWEPYRLTHPLAIGAPPEADLPGAYEELGDVARVLPDCKLRRGAEATLASLYQRDQHWGLLHFATHAHYHAGRPLESDIQLHDGNLRVKQLSQLSLADHALVALSVCQGGASKGQSLDEPVTLATGFSAAGADTVVANLWPVDDEVARAFFGAFYKELATGSSPSASFQQAQQQCRQTYPKARDWAGFFLLGNPG